MENNKNRTFIWGLILLTVCGFATALNVANIFNGTFEGGIQWVVFCIEFIGALSGMIKVLNTTD